MQVFGGVLFCLSGLTALLSGTIGFELDIFYVVIGIIGFNLFLYGTLQRNQHTRRLAASSQKDIR